MVSFANNEVEEARNLPARNEYPLKVRELLDLPSLAGSEVLAGIGGLDLLVTRINVMEVPDILPWVKPHELLLTTGFPLRDADTGQPFEAAALVELVEGLADRGVAALGVKAGRYLDALPAQMLAAADRLDFPILRLPKAVAFDDVMSDVFAQLIDRQAWALDVADRLHRALTAIVLGGGDQPQIAEEFAGLFGAAVLICTLDGRVQTIAGADDQVAALGALGLFDPSGRFRIESTRIGLQPAPGPVPGTSGAPGQLAVAAVAAGGTDLARIVAYRSEGGLNSVTVQALERAATVTALAMTKQLAVSAVESKFRGDFLRDALSGTAGSAALVIEHCRQLGWDVDRPLIVVVAGLDPLADQDPSTVVAPTVTGRSPQERFSAAWHQVLAARDKTIPVVGFSHDVVSLIPAHEGNEHSVVAEVIAAIQGDRGGGRRSFCAGVSRVVDSIDGLPAGYEQARRAVAVGRRMGGPGTVAHFDRLGVYRVLSLVSDGDELRAFAADVLNSLIDDTAEATDLRHTLQALLDSNCNVAETARLLHFHYNTLRYRIAKLERIVGPFTTDAHLRLNVNLALQVLQMRGL
jgi:PucR family transcriptional regulator, purine catabolism regulatory protein